MQQVYETDKIRNVVVLGHGGAGKTTLVEALAFQAGVTSRMGKVADGNTISDFDKEEAKRQFSISTTVVPVDFEGVKINFIDTPGYLDFVGEVEEALSVADSAVIVVNGKAGVEAGTERAMEYCEKYELPTVIFVTGMDDDNASFRKISLQLNEKYGRKIAPFHIPIRENEKFVGFVNVVKMKGRRFTTGSEYTECDIPEYLEKQLSTARESLVEAVAETSEDLMDKYFSGEEFTYEEVSSSLRTHVQDRAIIPVLMGAGVNNQGTKMLMQVILKYFASPAKRKVYGRESGNSEIAFLECDESKHMSAKVWKTMVDPFIGKYSFIKVVTGVLKADSMIYNVNRESEEKLAKLYILRGKEAIEVKELHAGDLGAVTKINNIGTGDTIAQKGATMVFDPPAISKPYTYMRYKANNKGDEDKIAVAMGKLMDEDLTVKVVQDSENRQSLLYGIGDQQLDIIVSKLSARYKVEVTLSKPKIAFRETIRKKTTVTGTHKKQSGGHGQYGVVVMEFEPSGDLEKPYEFAERVVGGSVPKNYFPAVEKGLAESVLKGPLAGYPVVGVKGTLIDGKYHPVDSSEMAFKTATINAFKAGVMDASPVLLEPIATMKVTVPNAFAGDVMGDMNKRRGRVMGMDHIAAGKQTVTAEIPMSEIYGYGTDLRSMTGGAGDYEYEFTRYEQAPSDVQAKIVAASKADEE
ncbi:MAG: elongation factor G [Lachnospiraceae bacterium]|nr:elongation factor G [Lachnospiraceae bacterium]